MKIEVPLQKDEVMENEDSSITLEVPEMEEEMEDEQIEIDLQNHTVSEKQIPWPQGEKWEDGLTPTEEELIDIIVPLIPKPLPWPKGEKGKDGKDGKDWKDGEKWDKGDTLRFADLTAYEKQILTWPQGSSGVGVPRWGTTSQVLAKKSSKDFDTEWVTGGGGWAVDSVNSQTGVVVLDTDDINDTATNRYTNDTDITRLANTSGTNTGDQVGDWVTITWAGTVWDPFVAVWGGSWTVTSVAISGSDWLEVDSGSPITTNGTIALWVNKTALLSHINVEDGAEVNTIDTVSDTSEIDLTITARALSASIVSWSIDESKLDTSVNASLDLADTALQAVPSGIDATKIADGSVSNTEFQYLDWATSNIQSQLNAFTNGMIYKGNWDASTGAFPWGWVAKIGWFYTVSVGWTVDSVVFVADDRIIATANNASTTTYAGNWNKLDATDAVTSVFGRVGNVVGANGDYTASNITNVPAGGIASVTVQAALDELDTEKAPKDDPTFTTKITTPVIRASTSGGVIIEGNSGTDIAILGAGGGAGVTWYGGNNYDLATQDTIAGFLWAWKTLSTLTTATYPSLTELSYAKWVTSAIQTQLNGKEPAKWADDNYVTDAQLVVIGNTSGTNSGNQTITNSSDATSHTVTLSATGGSVQLIEGSGITLTTWGTASAGTVTVASSGGSGATTALDNLASVAINTSLVSDTDNTDDLGTTLKKWANLFVTTIGATATRVTKVWATDSESTNIPTVWGTAILSSLTAPSFTTVELWAGGATDTTLSRVSAWVVAVEGKTIANLTDWGTFAADISVPDEAYGSGWNGSVEVPTKNAIYDKIETLSSPVITTTLSRPMFPALDDTMTNCSLNVNTTIRGHMFNLPAAITVNQIAIRVQTATTPWDINVAIFSEDGQTRQINITGTISGTGFTALSVSGVTLTAWNHYFLAQPVGTTSIVVDAYQDNIMNSGWNNASSQPIYAGDLTGSASTMVSTFNPVSDITPWTSRCVVFRLDN